MPSRVKRAKTCSEQMRSDALFDPNTLFTRQEISERTGIGDEVLNFWTKRGLLVSAEGGEGKGSHRRFRFSQVNIAAVLGVFRDKFGANVTVLASLAELFQRSVAAFERVRGVRVMDWSTAASLAQQLHEFRSGKPVEITVYDWEDPFHEEQKSRKSRVTSDRRPAKSEAEIIASFGQITDSWAPTVLRLAEALGPGRYEEARTAAALLGVILDPENYATGSWLMEQTAEGWRIHEAIDGTNFDRVGYQEPGPAVFLPISSMLRNVWGIPTYRVLRNTKIAESCREALDIIGVTATIRPSEEEGYYVVAEAPEDQWPILAPLLKEHAIYYRLTDGKPEGEEQP